LPPVFAALLALVAPLAVALALRSQPWTLVASVALAAAWTLGDLRTGHVLPARVAVPPRARRLAAPLLVVVVVVAVCAPTLRGDFLGDDFGYVRLFHDQPLASALRLGDISKGIWGHALDELRPVFALSFELGLLLHGPSAWGFHLTSVLLHAANSLLVYALARALAPGRLRTALLAGLIFGLMPVHAEPVAWITGKVDSLPTFFYLASVTLFARFRLLGSRRAYAGAVALYVIGIFSKEILVTLPAMLIAYDLLVARAGGREPGPWRRGASLALAHAPFVLTAAGFLLVRRLVFATFAREGRVGPALLWQFLEQQPEKARWLLLPFDAWQARAGGLWTAGGWGLPWAVIQSAVVLGVLLGAALALARRRSEHEPALALVGFFGLVFYLVTLAPLVVTYPSPRHLYLPSCGIAIALALVVFPPTREGGVRTSALRVAGAALLLATHAVWLRAASAEWTLAGEMSRRVRTRIAAATEALPAGSALVLSGVPATGPRLLAWKFALPFALQPPFVERDVYGSHRVFEPHDLYSRPLDQWWAAKQVELRALLAGADDERVDLTLLHWNARRRELVVRHARPERGRLRASTLKALGAPPQDVAKIDARRARGLIAALAEIARTSPE
jgi:hypothetical protein